MNIPYNLLRHSDVENKNMGNCVFITLIHNLLEPCDAREVGVSPRGRKCFFCLTSGAIYVMM